MTIYYDASCPICATEMAAIKMRDVNQRLELVDCSMPTFDDAEANSAGVSREARCRCIRGSVRGSQCAADGEALGQSSVAPVLESRVSMDSA
jgi:predicted DCC family thiol-disulfide oxidoreductase YuxK